MKRLLKSKLSRSRRNVILSLVRDLEGERMRISESEIRNRIRIRKTKINNKRRCRSRCLYRIYRNSNKTTKVEKKGHAKEKMHLRSK